MLKASIDVRALMRGFCLGTTCIMLKEVGSPKVYSATVR